MELTMIAVALSWKYELDAKVSNYFSQTKANGDIGHSRMPPLLPGMHVRDMQLNERDRHT